MREIALDTETTGIAVQDGHRIIEIGAVEMVDKYRTGKTYQAFINPQREISEGAFKVHGISQEFLIDKPVFENVAQEFMDFIGDARLIIHNAQFDMGFINHHLKQLSMPEISSEKVFCTLIHARKKYPGAKNNLDALCSRLEVDSSHRTKHGALLDAELLADVYAEMMGAGANQRNLLFANPQVAHEEKKPENVSRETKFLEPRVLKTSQEEEVAHKEFLAKIEKNIWEKIA